MTDEELVPHFVGRNVQHVELSGCKDVIRFTFQDGTQKYLVAEGDCCSRSWFESVEDLDFKGQILSLDNADIPDRELGWEDFNGDCIQVYFLTIKTAKGRLLIEMRNSSNGYYGGSFYVYNPDFYDGRDHSWTTICGSNEYGDVGI